MASVVLAGSATRTRTLRAAAEAGFGYTLILITIWSPLSIRNYFALAAALWISGSLLISGHGANCGFGLRALWRCSWAVVISLAAAAGMILLSARLGTLHFDSRLTTARPPLLGYMVGSLLQQIVLQLFLMARLLVLLRRPWTAIVVASLLFAAAHVPNPLLTLATLLWGLTACWLFLRYRSLLAVATIHFVLGACLAICVPATLHRNMRVGLGYIRYHASSPRAHALAPPINGLAPTAVPR
jgi:membrane protease YdiL (CAAX protease family)